MGAGLSREEDTVAQPWLKSARKLFFLQSSPLGLVLNAKQIAVVSSVCKLRAFQPGTWLYNQNSSCGSIYIVGSGEVKIYVDLVLTKQLAIEERNTRTSDATLSSISEHAEVEHSETEQPQSTSTMFSLSKYPGDIFGQECAIGDMESRRMGHAKAVVATECLIIDVKSLRKNLCASEEHAELVQKFMLALGERIPSTLVGSQLVAGTIEDILKYPVLWGIWKIRGLEKDEVLFEEGSMGTEMYIVYDGELRIVFNDQSDEEKEIMHVNIQKESIFGEIGVLVDTPRAGTVIANTKSMLLVLTKDNFNSLLKFFPIVGRRITESARYNAVRNFRKYDIPFFSSFTEEQFTRLGEVTSIVQIPPGEAIFEIGEHGDKFYIIAHGEVGIYIPKEAPVSRDRARSESFHDLVRETGLDTVANRPMCITQKRLRNVPSYSSVNFEERIGRVQNGNMIEICQIGPGRYFGELSLVTASARCATARAITRCVILSISKPKFDAFFEANPKALNDFQIKLAKYRISLSQLLTHKLGVMYFRAHCENEYSEENVEFYIQIREFKLFAKTCSELELLDEAVRIRDTFISDESMTQINVPWQAKDDLRSIFESSSLSPTMFDDCVAKVYALMERDSFQRFKASPLFQEFLVEMEVYNYAPNNNETRTIH